MYDEWNQVVLAVLKEVHQLDPAIYATGDLAVHREHITANGNRVARRIWGLRDWTFKYVDDVEIIVPADSHTSNPLAANWVNEGRQGGLWTNFDPRYQVKWARSGAVRNKIHSSPDETGTPQWYSVVRGANQGELVLLIFPKSNEQQSLVAAYEQQTPLLADGDPGDIGNIDAIPYQWRHILFEWTAAREYKDAGDLGQFQEQMQEVQQALFDMVCNESQGKPGQEMAPPYPGAPVESDWIDW